MLNVGRELCLGALLRQTLAKWPTFWQWKHVWLKAGHWDQPAGSAAAPLPWNVGVNSTGVCSSRGLCSIEMCFDCWLARLALCFLVVSWAWHLLIAEAKVRFFSCKRASTVSPSNNPSMIWFLMLFWVQVSEQKWHVFTNSHSEMRKSSKVLPV